MLHLYVIFFRSERFMVDGTFRHNDRRCGGQLRGRFPSWLGRDRYSKLLLLEAETATNSRQPSLHQQTKLLRYGSYEGGKVIVYSRHNNTTCILE